MRGRAALPLRLLLAVLLANMAAECRVSIPHTVVNPRTMASAASPHQTSARQGLNGDNLLVLLKHIPQGKQQLDILWDDVGSKIRSVELLSLGRLGLDRCFCFSPPPMLTLFVYAVQASVSMTCGLLH